MSHTLEIVYIQQQDVGNANMISTASKSVIVYNISMITAPGKYGHVSYLTLEIFPT